MASFIFKTIIHCCLFYDFFLQKICFIINNAQLIEIVELKQLLIDKKQLLIDINIFFYYLHLSIY